MERHASVDKRLNLSEKALLHDFRVRDGPQLTRVFKSGVRSVQHHRGSRSRGGCRARSNLVLGGHAAGRVHGSRLIKRECAYPRGDSVHTVFLETETRGGRDGFIRRPAKLFDGQRL
jgi:hypothetical protein